MSLGAPKQVDADGPANVNLVTTAETVICTLAGVSTTPEGDKVILEGSAQITTGAGTTGVQLRVRRGTTTAAPQVGNTQQTAVAAAVSEQVSIQVDDVPGEVAGQSYVF